MELVKYIQGFDAKNRDAVVEQIMKARIIRKAMETETGKALFNSAVDSISRKIMSIVGSCTDKEADQTEKIRKTATEIHVAFNLLREWATIIVDGDKHEEVLKK